MNNQRQIRICDMQRTMDSGRWTADVTSPTYSNRGEKKFLQRLSFNQFEL